MRGRGPGRPRIHPVKPRESSSHHNVSNNTTNNTTITPDPTCNGRQSFTTPSAGKAAVMLPSPSPQFGIVRLSQQQM